MDGRACARLGEDVSYMHVHATTRSPTYSVNRLQGACSDEMMVSCVLLQTEIESDENHSGGMPVQSVSCSVIAMGAIA